uniref:Uncharacterized protein n=1 Tax=Oryza glumipatula TaxID=40148 RepID=A0A0E0AZL5_9ORYZ
MPPPSPLGSAHLLVAAKIKDLLDAARSGPRRSRAAASHPAATQDAGLLSFSNEGFQEANMDAEDD